MITVILEKYFNNQSKGGKNEKVFSSLFGFNGIVFIIFYGFNTKRVCKEYDPDKGIRHIDQFGAKVVRGIYGKK
jgi:hypothetical protein